MQWNTELWVLWAVGLRFPVQLENSPFLPSHVSLEASYGMGILAPKRALRPFPSPEEAAAGCSPQSAGSAGV